MDGFMVDSYAFDTILPYAKDPVLFDAVVGEWSPGQIVGDKEALTTATQPGGTHDH